MAGVARGRACARRATPEGAPAARGPRSRSESRLREAGYARGRACGARASLTLGEPAAPECPLRASGPPRSGPPRSGLPRSGPPRSGLNWRLRPRARLRREGLAPARTAGCAGTPPSAQAALHEVALREAALIGGSARGRAYGAKASLTLGEPAAPERPPPRSGPPGSGPPRSGLPRSGPPRSGPSPQAANPGTTQSTVAPRARNAIAVAPTLLMPILSLLALMSP
jgi:hypothetical protein